MHLPDHVLDPTVSISTGLASAAAVGYAIYRLSRNEVKPEGALVGLTAAGVFAAQTLNFPIAESTSGHFLGGALAGILLGPWAGMLVVTAVLIIQCLVFQDGGLTALGANVLNMAVMGAGLGYWLDVQLNRRLRRSRSFFASAIACWLTVMTAAALCTVELSLGAEGRFVPMLAAMLPSHALIGVAEMLVTCGTLVLLAAPDPAIPQFVTERTGETLAERARFKRGVVMMVILSAACAPFASSLPDALEKALQTLSIRPDGSPVVWSPLAEYQIVGFPATVLGGSIAAILGTAIALFAAQALSGLVRRRKVDSDFGTAI